MADSSSIPFTGRYERGFLNHFFEESGYTVESYTLAEIADYKQQIIDMVLNDPTLSFGYMSDEKLTVVRIDEYPGWLDFAAAIGLQINPSPKLPKRLTVLTRLSYLHGFFDPDELKIVEVEPGEFTQYESADPDTQENFLDGANVIAREVVEQLMSQGSKRIDYGAGDPYEKEAINRGIDSAGSFSIRVIDSTGQIKGDCLAVPRDQMPIDADIIYCSLNKKREVTLQDKVFVLLEPHPGDKPNEVSDGEPSPPLAWADDQSMSWLGDWLYKKQEVENALGDFIESIYEDIRSYNYPRFFVDSRKYKDSLSTISHFQNQSLRWEHEGLGLEQSIFLQQRIGQGARNKFANTNKIRWPAICTMYVHVATDSWLHMAGFASDPDDHPWPFDEPRTERGCVWYHEATNRMIYNDLDFAEAFHKHGGWDLDDSIKAHARTYQGEKSWVNVRSPNSFGEYDIKKYVDGTYHPRWRTKDGSIVEFPELDDERPPFITEMTDLEYKYEDLSHATLGVQTASSPVYTRQMLAEAVDMALKFRGVFGKRANIDMVYFYTFGDYRRKQMARIESIVDACTQEPSQKALDIIEADYDNILKEIKTSGAVVDISLWKRRVDKVNLDPNIDYAELRYTQMLKTARDLTGISDRKFKALALRARDNIDSDVFELGQIYKREAHTIVRMFRFFENNFSVLHDEDVSSSEKYKIINDHLCSSGLNTDGERVGFADLSTHEAYDLALSIAAFVYTVPYGQEIVYCSESTTGQKLVDSYRDNILYQVSDPGKPSIFEYYIGAIQFYGIGDDSWVRTYRCSHCNMKRIYRHNDRKFYQAAVTTDMCRYCSIAF